MVVNKLAEIHSRYGIYSEEQINGKVQYNIIKDIENVPELEYLHRFYNDYFKKYNEIADGNWNHQKFNGDSIARSTDLSFIGSKVIEENIADYFFVFKGSLQKEQKLSMTVLSCFWLFDNISPYHLFLDRYWPNTHNYHPLIKNLGINKKIAERSYVTDFARIANIKGNRDVKKCKSLLLEEIKLLNPKFVILVGSEPRNAFANEIESYPEKYIHVPFSLIGVPIKTQEEGPSQYQKLRELIQVER